MTTTDHDADLRLTVLGCRAGMPEPGWPSSGYLVHAPDGAILLDCGPGVAAKAAARAAELSAVFISHMHTDHCLDLLILGKALALRGLDADDTTAPETRIPLYVPPGAATTLRRFNELFPLGTDGPGAHPTDHVFRDVFDVVEYEPLRPIRAAGATVLPVPMAHRQPCCGFRVTTPHGTLAYTGDTGPGSAFEPLVAGVDLLVAEATLDQPDRTRHGHLCAAEAGQLAARFGARALLLTHWAYTDRAWIDAQVERAREHYRGRIDVAVPDHTFHVDTDTQEH
ncbi:MBL fold metallo-hydrolase [Jiangella alkaliphila]|uniref:Ribonuclease BN, tRNA processing enzyme n=1 Tax=Jiangella alkaliphila TaxID=419479 RepID=A0A1H2LLH1_9ACTN|nr:MBL fold metallo-hydrolase [Jiangella alkaliphila]SDU81236.1 Ribonuclease BN, tRNA processing enzyme [Jiangella alkaliphila]